MIKQVDNLKMDKSPSPDDMNLRILKELSVELSGVLVNLYECSLAEGRLPDECEISK